MTGHRERRAPRDHALPLLLPLSTHGHWALAARNTSGGTPNDRGPNTDTRCWQPGIVSMPADMLAAATIFVDTDGDQHTLRLSSTGNSTLGETRATPRSTFVANVRFPVALRGPTLARSMVWTPRPKSYRAAPHSVVHASCPLTERTAQGLTSSLAKSDSARPSADLQDLPRSPCPASQSPQPHRVEVSSSSVMLLGTMSCSSSSADSPDSFIAPTSVPSLRSSSSRPIHVDLRTRFASGVRHTRHRKSDSAPLSRSNWCTPTVIWTPPQTTSLVGTQPGVDCRIGRLSSVSRGAGTV